MQYSVPYIILVLFYGILALFRYSTDNEQRRKQIDIAGVAIFVFFFGFRGYVFDDWINYTTLFHDIDWSSLIDFFTKGKFVIEPGFMFFSCCCKSIMDNYHFFVFMCTLVNTALLVTFLRRYTDNLPLSIMIFICMGGLEMSVNLMRNSMSMLMVLNGIHFIWERRLLPWLGTCLLAITFHLSAIIYLPLFFILHRDCNRWVYLGIFLAANAILIMRVPVLQIIVNNVAEAINPQLQMRIEGYMERTNNIGFRLSLGYLERLFTGLLVFCYIDKLKEIRKENVMFINSMLIFFLMYFLFSEFDEVSKRLSNLFAFAYWIIWIDMIKCFSIENNKRLFIGFLYVYCVLKIIGCTNFVTGRYDNVLFGAQSYQERLYIHNRNTVY